MYIYIYICIYIYIYCTCTYCSMHTLYPVYQLARRSRGHCLIYDIENSINKFSLPYTSTLFMALLLAIVEWLLILPYMI